MVHTLLLSRSGGLRWLFAFLLTSGIFSSARADTGIFQTYAIVNAGSGNTYRAGGNNADNAASFINFSYGTFTNANTLILNGGQIKSFKNGTGDVTGAHLHYRVYLLGSTPGAFTDLNLPFSANHSGGDQVWERNNANINLLNSSATAGGANNLTVRGRYVIEAYWRITSNEGDRLDGSSTTPYKAYFDFDPSTFTSVTQSPVNGQVPYGDAVTVTATLSSAAGSGQFVYLRYSTDNFATCTIAPMTNSTGTQYTASIPNQTSGTDNPTVRYYAFTSFSSTAPTCAGADAATLRYGNNGGANYSYVYGVDFSAVTQSPTVSNISSTTPVTVTATLSATPSAGEYVYLRYHIGTGTFAAGDPVLAMSKSGQTATATIPAQSGMVTYYAFTSPNAGVTAATLASATALKFGSNGGANYTYTPYAISATVTNGGPICANTSTDLFFNLSGMAPWTISYSKAGVAQTPVVLTASPYTIATGTLASTTVFDITDIVDSKGNRPAGLPSSTTVTVNARPTATITHSSGNCAGTPVTVTFNFTGVAPFNFTYSDGTTLTNATSNSNTYVITPTLASSTTFSITAFSDGNFCTAASSPAAQTTVTVNTSSTWTGASSTSWTDAANWSSGCVPNRAMNATIPSGLSRYPELTAAGSALEVASLTLDNGAKLTQTAGTLDVYGDINNANATNGNGTGLTLTTGSPATSGPVVTIRGAIGHLLNNVDEVWTLVLNTDANSTTNLNTGIRVDNMLTMMAGKLQTNANIVTLATAATISESETSYVTGQVRIITDISAPGVTNTAGNLGLRLTPAAGSVVPGSTTVTRMTGTPLTNGTNSGSQRWFRITPATDAGLNLEMTMEYFAHESNGIAEGDMTLFSTPTPGDQSVPNSSFTQYTTMAATPSANYYRARSVSGLTHLSDWTLGSSAAPLPVTLAAFEATRQQRGVVLRWTTATERNSRGFEVQVSTNGQEFKPLAFVASASANSTTAQQYSYLDREAGTAGTRYYRLRQLDLDGTASFSPVRTVQLATAEALQLAALPNPFTSSFTLLVQTPTAQVQALLTLTDLLGRVQYRQQLAVVAGHSELPVAGLEHLPAGVYVVRLQLAGQTHQVKVVKN